MRSKIYQGLIQHERLFPVAHDFQYSLNVFAVDLAELPQLNLKLPLFGYNRLRVSSLYDGDYLYREAGSLNEKLNRCLTQEGVTDEPDQVILVTSPRYFNYVFNPVSFFYCYAENDRLLCVVVEVNNTYGERHHYVLKDPLVRPDTPTSMTRYTAPKAFHVSPYNRIEGEYDFNFSDIRKNLDIHIQLKNADKVLFGARLTGKPLDMGPLNHLKIMVQNPLVPHLSIPRIWWEAFRLAFVRKLPFHDKPVPPSDKTIGPKNPSLFQSLARKVVCSHFDRLALGSIRMRTPGGEVLHFGNRAGGPSAEIRVRDNRFFTRTMLGGEIGFGESYEAGEWSSPDLAELLHLIVRNRDSLSEGNWFTSFLRDRIEGIHHYFRKNKIGGSRENIQKHYDIGNDFFGLYLDPTMAYSSAVFESENDSLETAQHNKYMKIIRKADLRKTDHVLEIGCGWGGFAEAAVRATGCRVTAVTLSEAQYEYVNDRIRRHGLENRIQVLLKDYRHLSEQYDKIVSIEMIEAVGHQYLGQFFAQCDRLLKRDGLVVIQAIINADQRYDKERKKSDWLKKHIFPGGQVPSLTAISEAMTRHSDLMIMDVENIADHYALTLDRWRRALNQKEKELARMGFDPGFKRKWEYYLALCGAGFSTRALRNLHLVLSREFGNNPPRPFKVRSDV